MTRQRCTAICGAMVLLLAGSAAGCGGDDSGTTTGPASAGTGSTAPDPPETTTNPSTSAMASSGSSTADSTTADSTTTASSTTAADSTGPGGSDSTGPGEGTCPTDHVCFVLDGVFHVPDEATPTATYDIPLPPGIDYHVIEVELTVTHGGWYPDDPAGLHNIFWLHRGTYGDFTWMGGVAGYVNARGPGSNVIRTRHDLDVLDLADSQTFNINGVALQPDHTYRVFYRYDTLAAEVLVEITENGAIVAQGTDVPTTDLVRNTQDSFFIYFANDTDVAAPGPEVPSLGWTFADLRVEFMP